MDKKKYLRTIDLAREAGIHPNTVRLYEQWGFLPPIPRSPKGYRLFTARHLDLLRLARTALHTNIVGGDVRQAALDVIYTAAKGDLGGALDAAYRLQARIQAERDQAEAAASTLERWAADTSAAETSGEQQPLRIGDAARLLNSTVDSLHNWERNGLISVPRDPHNGYRLYAAPEIGRLRVIRMLIRSGYSTMAVLRMLTQLDRGQASDLRQALDTPAPDEDALYASDHWLSTLAEAGENARRAVGMIEKMLKKEEE